MNRHFIVAALFALASTAWSAQPPAAKARLVVLTDIEADPDDTQSLVRLFLYSNEIDIEGLVATTSIHMRDEIHPDSVVAVIDKYGEVRANLGHLEDAVQDLERCVELSRETEDGAACQRLLSSQE